MPFTKVAKLESVNVLDVRSSPQRREASLNRFSDFDAYRTSDGFIYARVRAISSRVNKNRDIWPSVELAGSQDIFDRHLSTEGGFVVEANRDKYKYGFSTFMGKPVFVDHHNHDPKKARGVIVDARLHVEDNKTAALDPFYASDDSDPSLLPPTWVELLLEVDGKAFPRLAAALIEGSKDSGSGIDGFSMGANVGHTVCNICYHKATDASQFCQHIANGKTGTYNLIHPQTGKKISRKAGEFCHDVSFFELSCVFDPADETALMQDLKTAAARFPARTAKTADNPLPQAMHERAPTDVDTLRNESVCDICGSLMDGQTCSVCGWVQEPEGLNNPDLGKAREVKQEMQQQEQQDPSAQPQGVGGPPPVGNTGGQGGTFGNPYQVSPTNNPTTAGVTNRPMKWELSLHPKTAGKINTGERPILPGNPPVSNEPRETTIKDYPRPTTSAMQTAQQMLAAVERNQMRTADSAPSAASPGGAAPEAATPDTKGDVEGVGGYIEDSNDAASKADAQVDVTGVGATPAKGVSADESEDVTQGTEKSKFVEAIPTMTWSDGKGDSLGQHEPVTPDSGDMLFDSPPHKSHEVTAYESGPGDMLIENTDSTAVEGVQPADSVGVADERVNVLDSTTTPENNSGPTKTWSGTDGNGVLRQQEPVTSEVPWSQDPATNAGVTSRTQLLAALKLAETEVELGLLAPEKKYARIAELENESIDAIRASLKFANRVKQAGLQRRVAKVAKVPSFSNPVQMKEASIDEIDDSAIFS